MFRSFLPAVLLCLCTVSVITASVFAADTRVDIREFGAKGDGKTLCTEAIQKAIDRCADRGGGTVLLPTGTWLSGTITMKNNVTLWLEAGCTLLGSAQQKDYPKTIPAVRSYTDLYVCQALIAGEDLHHVAIRGQGTIDGNGAKFGWREWLNRPYVIRFVNCSDVLVEGVTMKASPMWMQHYLACQRVIIRGITVFNHVGRNNDGLDIDGCMDVCVSDCIIDADDDAIVLKSTLDRPCENVTVTNCVLSSHCNAFKTGTESNGGFKNITFSNSAICSPAHSRVICGRQRGLAGIALENVDGGVLDRIAISNITITGVSVPIFIRFGNRARPYKEDMPKPGVGVFRNVMLSNIVATGCDKTGCAISGIPGHEIENLWLRDIMLSFDGGGTAKEAARAVPEQETRYPECHMFGILPSYGLYCRHIKGLRLNNVQLRTTGPDQRHAVILDDVQDAVINDLAARWSPRAAAMMRFTQVREALIRGCRPPSVDTFLRVEGDASRGIALLSNDFRHVGKIADTAPDVPDGALFERANLTPKQP
jgi:hypothetical protein